MSRDFWNLSPPPQRHRFVKRSQFYLQSVEKIRKIIPRIDYVLSGIESIVRRHAELGHPVPGTPLRFLKSHSFPQAPPIRAVYMIDDEENATMHGLSLIPGIVADAELDDIEALLWRDDEDGDEQ